MAAEAIWVFGKKSPAAEASEPAAEPWAGQRWEYRQESAPKPDALMRKARAAGAEGWELVSVWAETVNGTTFGVVGAFKRPLTAHVAN